MVHYPTFPFVFLFFFLIARRLYDALAFNRPSNMLISGLVKFRPRHQLLHPQHSTSGNL